MKLPKRKHPRLDNYDYSGGGVYFITICTHNKRCILSRIVGRGLAPAVVEKTEYGEIAQAELLALEKRYPFVKVDRYVIMPNHIHVLLLLEGAAGASPRPTVPDVICAYKSLTTRACKEKHLIAKLFQDSFYEHIVRGRMDYDEIVKYIDENPIRWCVRANEIDAPAEIEIVR